VRCTRRVSRSLTTIWFSIKVWTIGAQPWCGAGIWLWLDHIGVVQNLHSEISSPLVARLNKGGGPRVPFCTKMKISRMPVPIDQARVLCFRRLCRRDPLGASCLEITSSEKIWSCAPVFFSSRLVSEGVLRSSASY
jgi:hypothetical protein